MPLRLINRAALTAGSAAVSRPSGISRSSGGRRRRIQYTGASHLQDEEYVLRVAPCTNPRSLRRQDSPRWHL